MSVFSPIHRRALREEAEAAAYAILGEARVKAGIDGFGAAAEGLLRQIALELVLRNSVAYACQFFNEAFVQEVLDESVKPRGLPTGQGG